MKDHSDIDKKTEDEINWKAVLEKTFSQTYGALTLEEMRFLVHLEKEARKAKGEEDFNCYVIDSGQLKHSILPALKELKSKIDHCEFEIDLRIQFIVHVREHYFTIDCMLSKDSNECILLDAAGASAGVQTILILENMCDEDDNEFFKAIYLPSEGKLQNDFLSCPVFSFDHAVQISRIDDIYAKLAKLKQQENQNEPDKTKSLIENTVFDIRWIMLPPQLIWNVQSLKWAEEYVKLHPDEINITVPGTSMTFLEYIKENTGKINLKDDKQLNLATQNLPKQYQERALTALPKYDKTQLNKIIRLGLKFNLMDVFAKQVEKTKEHLIAILSVILHDEEYVSKYDVFLGTSNAGIKEMRDVIDNRKNATADQVITSLKAIIQKFIKEKEGHLKFFKKFVRSRQRCFKFYNKVKDSLNGDDNAKFELEKLAIKIQNKNLLKLSL